MGSLKDALMNAGYKPSKPEVAKKHKVRNNSPKKKVHTHQGHRNFCEVCNNTFPDVEFYNHRLPNVKAKWICLQCADRLGVPDECRETKQSEYSRKGIFRREYGRTKRYFPRPKEEKPEEKSGKKPFFNKNKKQFDNKKPKSSSN